MEHPQVTGGEVAVMQRVKTGDYEHKEVKVSLNFSIPEGKDFRDYFDQIAQEANNKTRALLGLQPLAARPHGNVKKVIAPVVVPGPVAVQDPALEAGKAAIAEAAAAFEDGKKTALAAAAAVFEKPADAAAVVEDPPANAAAVTEPAANDPAAVTDVADEWVAEREVTDKDLGDMVTAHNAKVKNPKAIKALLAKYAPEGLNLRSIPQDNRKAFLKELAEVKAAA